MTHETETILSWLMQILGSAATGIASAVMYLNRRLKAMEKQLAEHETKLAVGGRNFEHIDRRLDEMAKNTDRRLDDISDKQDMILEALLKTKGGQS